MNSDLHKTRLDKYAENQRLQYDATSVTRGSAERQVAPNYKMLRDTASNYVDLMMREYFIRQTVSTQESTLTTDAVQKLSFLDFGCGVGRVMESLVELGAGRVDGADISHAMIEHAKNSALLKNSQFFLTGGTDVGDAPKNTYDVVYSFLCLHHIPMRQTRISIIEKMVECLRPGGMCFIEFKLFPGVLPHKIPENHASWVENKPAKYTNSRADVWITPDSIGYVYQDLSLFLSDIFMLEAETDHDHFEHHPDKIYQYSFNPFFVGGFKGSHLYTRLGKKPIDGG